MVLLTHYGSQLQQSCPSLTLALLTSYCPKPHGVGFWSNCYSPILCPIFRDETIKLFLLRMNSYSTRSACTWENLRA